RFSKEEIKDLLKAWIAITLAFTIVNVGLSLGIDFVIGFLISGLTVGLGFMAHELSHKFLAQRYGCFAEFRSFDQMLILAVLVSFLGFVFAAPGAVFISGHVSKDQSGKISVAGIFANILIAALFLLLVFLGNPLLKTIGIYGVTINSWLALFNLIPFGNFDGIKVFHWNKIVYVGMLLTAGILLMVPGLLSL
ncbi:hypothetical protein A3K72_01380, partial [Candidatus Woesearchaeota archaeon RBG_13_36_6]